MEKYIRMENILKRFPGVTACNDISMEFTKGEIHALLGENGAGKSTLMNILYGLLKKDEGEIYIKDEKVTINSSQDAISLGIGMVHQHFMLIPKFTVIENIVLGTKFKREPLLDYKTARKRVKQILEMTGLGIPLDEKVQNLCIGDQQKVEIIKALYKGATTLIMDEPTAVLTPAEVDELFLVLKKWVKEGNTVIFITHKMREVVEICDRISVLRDGSYFGTYPVEGLDEKEVAELMVGREVSLNMNRKPQKRGAEILSVKHLNVKSDLNMECVKDVSFSVAAGEVVGIAGVDGNGQLELVEAIMGLRSQKEGSIQLNGESIEKLSPRKVLDKGISNIPFERQKEGLALEFPISENFILKEEWKAPYKKKFFLDFKYINQRTREAMDTYRIKAKTPETQVGNMSGGNQQKVVLAREIERDHQLLIACHPTHGLDIGAIEFIHQKIMEERDRMKGILLISTELEELISLSDRILVMYQGEIMGEVTGEIANVPAIGAMMLGARESKC